MKHIDSASYKSFRELRDSGKHHGDLMSVLNIFRKAGKPLYAREAHQYCLADGLDIDLNGVRSRMTELAAENMRLLEKVDKVTDPESHKTVNRWQPSKPVREIPEDLFDVA